MSVIDNLLSTPDEIVTLDFVRKNLLKIFSNKFFSIYNYLFVSFLYSVFNEHVTFFEKKGNQRNFTLLNFNNVNGGDDGIRTHDPLLAGQVLSQLSYTPIKWLVVILRFFTLSCLVGPSGLEPL